MTDYKCPVNNCELTFDREKLQNSSMVLFHLRNLIDHYPKFRRLDQHWVHVINESPLHCHKCVVEDGLFNLSSTYTKDSDFSSVYWTESGLFWDESRPGYVKPDVFVNKTKFGATLVRFILFFISVFFYCA